MDGVRRIALVETKTVDTSIPAFTPETVTRLQMGNHLGSTALEVDLTGLVISYEEAGYTRARAPGARSAPG